MEFNVFAPFLLFSYVINFSVDIIQNDRFKYERRIYRENLLRLKKIQNGRKSSIFNLVNKDNLTTLIENKQQNDHHQYLSETLYNKSTLFITNFIWMFKHHKIGLVHFLISLIHIMWIIIFMTKCLLYSILPTDRDLITNEYLDSTLNYLESIYIVDMLHKYDKQNLVKRVLALAYLQYLILRLLLFFGRYNSAKLNKNYYKRINVVQLDWSYMSSLKSNFFGWIRFLFHEGSQHDCKIDETLDDKKGKSIKQFQNDLNHLCKIDRLYYYNQIDFNLCFENISIKSVHKYKSPSNNQEEEFDIIPYDDNNTTNRVDKQESSKKSKGKILLKNIQNFLYPTTRMFVAQPVHRVDPYHLRILFIILILATSVSTFTIGSLFWLMYFGELEDLGLNYDNFFDTFQTSSIKFLINLKLVFGLIFNVFMNSLLCVNVCDNGLLAYSSILCHSRAFKIKKLLQKQVVFYKNHNKFTQKLINEHINSLINDEEEDSNVKQIQMINSNDEDISEEELARMVVMEEKAISSNNNKITEFDEWTLSKNVTLTQKSTFTNKPMFMDGFIVNKELNIFDKRTISYSNTSSLNIPMIKKKYHNKHMKNQHMQKENIVDFNSNICYLIDLIGILQNELNDLKNYFTTYLNLNIIFGTGCSIISTSLLLDARNFREFFISFATFLVTLVPLIFSLFIGATSERAVSMIDLVSEIRFYDVAI